MTQYALKVNSYIGSDTRIQVVKERPPKKETYELPRLDRNAESKTIPKNEQNTDKNPRRIRRAPRSQNRLSPHARQVLQRIGGAVDVFFNATNAIFLTGTFPGESFECQSAIAEQAGWLVNALKAWIYKRCGANIAWWAWEFQKRGTLHLHYVAVIPCESDRLYVLSEFRNEWIRLIAGASRRSGENLFIGRKHRDFFSEKELLQIYAKEVYKSATAYLAKYIAKKKSSRFPSPCRLWGCTKEARNLVAKHCISIIVPSIALHKAEDLAYKYDSYSNIGNEKRRYFRHRFSQGFTILLYDDSLRSSLEPDKKMTSDEKILANCMSRINTRLTMLHCLHDLYSLASKPLKEQYLSNQLPLNDMVEKTTLVDMKANLIELHALVALCPSIPFYAEDDVRNLIKAAITCTDKCSPLNAHVVRKKHL